MGEAEMATAKYLKTKSLEHYEALFPGLQIIAT